MHENRPDAPGAPGQDGAHLETSPVYRPARETRLRWQRQGFKIFWKYKSRAMSAIPKISAETIALIQEMARDNRLWGAERIRGELLKLSIRGLPHYSAVHEICAHYKATRTELEDLLTHVCSADLGVRRACLSPISSSVRCSPFSWPNCTRAE